MKGPEEHRRSFWIDRVEGDLAILHGSTGVQFELPITLLPPGATEGSWLTLSLELDPERTADEKGAVQTLLSRLDADDDGGDLVL